MSAPSPLALVAASGLAREVIAVLTEHEDRELVVVDDDPARWGTRLRGVPVAGPVQVLADLPDHEVVVCVGRGSRRQALVARLSALGIGAERYATVVHPRVQVPRSCAVGAGSIVLESVTMTTEVRVGRHVVLMPGVTLTHDDVVDDYATLCAGVSLGGAVRVGAAAYVGMNACVREGTTIGAQATLGMGAVLVRDLPVGETWVGSPARSLRVPAGAEGV